jgi:hypothetical protein
VLYFGRKVIPLLLFEYAVGGATTIIITENKLPLGVNYPNI